MPVQNNGTLLENIVVAEAAQFLCHRTTTGEAHGPLDFANAFAMPPLSEWRDTAQYDYQVGLREARLDRLAEAVDEPGGSYTALLRRCLRANRAAGPNGALLVGAIFRAAGRPARMWLNDLEEGSHYADTVTGLRRIADPIDRVAVEFSAVPLDL
jgi:hypothetical protein